MFIIRGAIIEEDIAHIRFACDLQECKGACCTLPGGRGAPLEDSELEEIERSCSHAFKYLSAENLREIRENGMVEGMPGGYATRCLDDRDCVFVFYENTVAYCSLEKAFFEGKTSWRKPISCHLFPVRISRSAGENLRYEQLRACAPAKIKGLAEDVPLYDFLREALVRRFGLTWYKEFRSQCSRLDNYMSDNEKFEKE